MAEKKNVLTILVVQLCCATNEKHLLAMVWPAHLYLVCYSVHMRCTPCISVCVAEIALGFHGNYTVLSEILICQVQPVVPVNSAHSGYLFVIGRLFLVSTEKIGRAHV